MVFDIRNAIPHLDADRHYHGDAKSHGYQHQHTNGGTAHEHRDGYAYSHGHSDIYPKPNAGSL